MCSLAAVYNVVCYWSPEARARRARGTVQGALDVLRHSQRNLAANIERKRRRMQDFDRAIMEIGLACRRPGGQLGGESRRRPLLPQEKAAFAHELRMRQLCMRRMSRCYDLLATVEEQISMLEESGMMQDSISAMRTGAAAAGQQMIRPEEVERILERVAEQQAQVADTANLLADQAAVNDSMAGLDGQALEDELASLMESQDFVGQFDPDDLARASKAAAAPPPPPEDDLIKATRQRIARPGATMLLDAL